MQSPLVINSQTKYTQVLALPNQTDQELNSQLVTTTQEVRTVVQ